jgi:hypothetical protein
MGIMKRITILLTLLMLTASANAAVKITVEDVNGLVAIQYECTAGEVVRAFALDVKVDAGTIDGISGFFAGECTLEKQGYGIFPASLRDNIEIDATGEVVSWDVEGYNPLAKLEDCPEGTLAGLGTGGVTLELGGLWAADNPALVPASKGTLCLLQISAAANVTVTPNVCRRGIVLAQPEIMVVEAPEITGALVDPANAGAN